MYILAYECEYDVFGYICYIERKRGNEKKGLLSDDFEVCFAKCMKWTYECVRIEHKLMVKILRRTSKFL